MGKATALMLAIFFAALAPSVSAQAFDIELGFDAVSSCPTILSDSPPLDKSQLPVFITNNYKFPDTYKISLELPPGWSGFAALQAAVGTGERTQIQPFWITIPDVEPGRYRASLTVESGQTGQRQLAEFDVDVLSCRSVKAEPVERFVEACVEEGSIEYTIEVRNLGKAEEEVMLSADGHGASFDSTSVRLRPQESRHVTLSLKPPEGVSEGEVRIVASSKASYARAEQTLRFRAVQCKSLEITLTPESLQACEGEDVEFNADVASKGTIPTDYNIVTTIGIPSRESLSLSPGEEESIGISVPTGDLDAGTKTLTLTVFSRGYKAEKRASLDLRKSEECYNVDLLSLDGAKVFVQQQEGFAFPVTIKNAGIRGGIFRGVLVGPDWAYLDPDAYILQPGNETQAFVYASPRFDTPEGAYPAKLIVTSPFLQEEADIELHVSKRNATASGNGAANFTGGLGNSSVTGLVSEGASLGVYVWVIVGILILVLAAIKASSRLKGKAQPARTTEHGTDST